MTVIKNQKSNTYEVRTYYKDWTGVRKQKTKRGFKRKCDAQEWERAFKLKENLSLDMYFEDFVDLYLNDIKSRIKYNTWLTKKHIVEKKILPYFSKKKLQEIKPSDIRQWQNTMMNYRNKQGEGYSQVYLKTITDKDLIGATALSQDEFDYIVDEFELEKRTILIYAGGNFDKVFLSEYMKRHQISGFDKLRFYNFKRNIISSKYSHGNITKDNLWSIFNIDGVKQVHNSLNDCKLEWKLFERMGGYYYLVTEGNGGDNVFRLNEDYIIPASLLSSHPNLSRILTERPYIECQSKVIKSFEIDAKGIEKFPTNFTGMTIEHLINSMLEVDKQNSLPFLEENKRKLDFIGKIDNGILALPMVFNLDGTVTALHKKDNIWYRYLVCGITVK